MAAAKEIKVDARAAGVLSEADGIFTINEQKRHWTLFSVDIVVLHLADLGKSFILAARHSPVASCDAPISPYTPIGGLKL